MQSHLKSPQIFLGPKRWAVLAPSPGEKGFEERLFGSFFSFWRWFISLASTRSWRLLFSSSSPTGENFSGFFPFFWLGPSFSSFFPSRFLPRRSKLSSADLERRNLRSYPPQVGPKEGLEEFNDSYSKEISCFTFLNQVYYLFPSCFQRRKVFFSPCSQVCGRRTFFHACSSQLFARTLNVPCICVRNILIGGRKRGEGDHYEHGRLP